MTWNEIDSRLYAVGKDRRWLADVTPYTYDTIRNTMAPGSTKKTDRMLSVLSRAIEDEEAKHRQVGDIAHLLEFELAYLAYRNPAASKTYPEIVRSSLKVAGVEHRNDGRR